MGNELVGIELIGGLWRIKLVGIKLVGIELIGNLIGGN